MFCPKCGTQNGEGTRFCRACGMDVSTLSSSLIRLRPEYLTLAEKHIDLLSAGIRGLMIGSGFLAASITAFAINIRYAVLGLFFFAFASYFAGTGVSRLIQAKALKRLLDPKQPDALSGYAEFVKPARSAYETDELASLPASVTENTTTHLEIDPEARK